MSDKDVFYRYYWFDQTITDAYSKEGKRRILIFESDIETIETMYNYISKWYDFCESAYCGFGGIVIIFENPGEKHHFRGFDNIIKKN